MRTRIKICGITTSQDASHAANCGADAIGLVFCEKSVRYVTESQGREIAAALPPFVSCVGLFVDAARDMVESVLEQVPLDVLQFHGHESAAECRVYGKPYIKAVPMADELSLSGVIQHYPDAIALLLDSHSNGGMGGTGEVFDWTRVQRGFSTPIILAGGLDSDNVGIAIGSVQPYAVDVSSGVESGRGIKDPVKVTEFIQEVRRVDSENAKSVKL